MSESDSTRGHETTFKFLAAKLLRDAATFFTTLGDQNAALTEQMLDNREVFLKVADLVERDPHAQIQDGSKHADLAGKLLRDAAEFFITLAKQNPPISEQMEENANVYRQLAEGVIKTPDDDVDDPSRAPVESTTAKADPIEHITLGRHRSMAKVPLTLGVSYPVGEETDSIVELGGKSSLRAAVLSRDNHTCAACGFVSPKYQEVVGPRKRLWDMPRLRTLCIFCSQVGMLDIVSKRRSGVLIWLPEVAQADLNNLLKVTYVCRISQGDSAATARRFLDALMTRRQAAIDLIGTDDPWKLAEALTRRDPAQLGEYRQKLLPIRLAPLDRRIIKEGDLEFNQFPQILAYWRSKDGPFGGLLPRDMDVSALATLADQLELEAQQSAVH